MSAPLAIPLALIAQVPEQANAGPAKRDTTGSTTFAISTALSNIMQKERIALLATLPAKTAQDRI